MPRLKPTDKELQLHTTAKMQHMALHEIEQFTEILDKLKRTNTFKES